nr:meiotically up-regulated gene 89 protein [Quercus suber]
MHPVIPRVADEADCNPSLAGDYDRQLSFVLQHNQSRAICGHVANNGAATERIRECPGGRRAGQEAEEQKAPNAPACPTYATIPSEDVSSYFKNSSDSAPQWCRNTTDVGYGVDNAITVTTPTCHVQFRIPDDLKPPILLYYQLTNFYQNHRRYVKSFDQDQLNGKFRSVKDINGSDCDPLKGEMDPTDGVFKPYYPCGLIANSMFNDTIFEPVLLNTVADAALNQTYPMTTNGTAWSSDADLYNPTAYALGDVLPPPNWRVRYPTYNASFPFPALHTDDHFQVWMRTAGLPTFSKLYRRNDNQTMASGQYEVVIYDNFPVTIYGGTKSILLSTRTVMGGKNPFLGIAYIVVGGLCIVLGTLFTLTQLIRPRKLGDHSYLSWNTEESSTATTTGRAARPNEGA